MDDLVSIHVRLALFRSLNKIAAFVPIRVLFFYLVSH